jgi:hypothetical protein
MKKLAIILISMMTAFTSFAPAQAFPTVDLKPTAQTSDVQQVRDDRRFMRRHDNRHGWRNDRNRRHYDRRDRRHRSNAGAIIGGLAAGAIIGSALSQSRSNASGSCAARFRSYRASDQTYQPNSGPRRRCID